MPFDAKYEVFHADTLKSKALSYKLRHKVYCLETGFENPKEFPLGMEFDTYDDDAEIFLVRKSCTKEWVGTVRVVKSTLGEMPSNKVIEQTPEFLASYEYNRFLSLANDRKVVEISRLCVLEKFRKQGSASQQKEGFLIMTGLLRAAYSYCFNNDFHDCFFTVTPSLDRVLKSMNFNYCAAGELSDYHGLRIPNYCYIPSFTENLKSRSPSFAKMFKKAAAYQSFEKCAHVNKVGEEVYEIKDSRLYAV